MGAQCFQYPLRLLDGAAVRDVDQGFQGCTGLQGGQCGLLGSAGHPQPMAWVTPSVGLQEEGD